MFSRHPRPRSGDGGLVIRRPKRVKTYHNSGGQVGTVEDEVIREFQEILGQLRGGGETKGGPVVEYDGVVEVNDAAVQNTRDPTRDWANYPEYALPEADLKNVPPEPSLQALWIAREIKRLAVYNEEHGDNPRVKSPGTPSSATPAFDINTANHIQESHGNTSSPAGSWRSGRKKRQTDKARSSHLVDLDADDDSLRVTRTRRNPKEGLERLSALARNERIHHALSHSLNLGIGNFERRHTFGIQFLQSMAADTIPPDPAPAAELKHSLWRCRKPVPVISALHILAGFSEVVEAIDIAFQGRLDWRTPLVEREGFSYGIAPPTSRVRGGREQLKTSSAYPVDLEDDRPNQANVFPNFTQPAYRASFNSKLPKPYPPPDAFPRLLPKVVAGPSAPQNVQVVADETLRDGSDLDDSFESAAPASRHFTVIDPVRSAEAVAALHGATELLHDMAYGALKNFFPPTNGQSSNRYSTPYGMKSPDAYVTPYANPPQGQPGQDASEPRAPKQPVAASRVLKSSPTNKVETYDASRPINEDVRGRESFSSNRKGKGKEREHEQPNLPSDVLESTENDKLRKTTTTSGPVDPPQQQQDDEEDYTQIDSLLALAAGDDSDSDDDMERERTVSQDMIPTAIPRKDHAVESVVEGIIFELATNQNRGHGLGFLNPQTHLYQISHGQQFADGLKAHVNDAKLEMNCVVSAAHSRALQAFFDAIVKRITNPYLEGALPQYSNIVYLKGKAYQAIPGPDHPMFHQQPPYPPPPPPSSEMILPSQSELPPPPPDGFPPRGFLPILGPSPQSTPLPFPGSPPHPGPPFHPGPSPHAGSPPQIGGPSTWPGPRLDFFYPPGAGPPPHSGGPPPSGPPHQFGPPPHSAPPSHFGPPPHSVLLPPPPPPGYMHPPGLFPPPGMFPPPGFPPPPGMMPMKIPIDPLRRGSYGGKGATKKLHRTYQRTYRFKPAKSRAASETVSPLQGFQASAYQRPVFFPNSDPLGNGESSSGPRKRKRKLQLTASDLAPDTEASIAKDAVDARRASAARYLNVAGGASTAEDASAARESSAVEDSGAARDAGAARDSTAAEDAGAANDASVGGDTSAERVENAAL